MKKSWRYGLLVLLVACGSAAGGMLVDADPTSIQMEVCTTQVFG